MLMITLNNIHTYLKEKYSNTVEECNIVIVEIDTLRKTLLTVLLRYKYPRKALQNNESLLDYQNLKEIPFKITFHSRKYLKLLCELNVLFTRYTSIVEILNYCVHTPTNEFIETIQQHLLALCTSDADFFINKELGKLRVYRRQDKKPRIKFVLKNKNIKLQLKIKRQCTKIIQPCNN